MFCGAFFSGGGAHISSVSAGSVWPFLQESAGGEHGRPDLLCLPPVRPNPLTPYLTPQTAIALSGPGTQEVPWPQAVDDGVTSES